MSEVTNIQPGRDFTVENVQKLNVVDILLRALRYWYLFVLSLAICISLAILKAKTTIPIWDVSGQIVINDDSNDSFSQLGSQGPYASFLPPRINTKHELEILTSPPLIKTLVKQAHLNTRILKVTRFIDAEIYDGAPFKIVLKSKNESFPHKLYNINILNDGEFSMNADDETEKVITGKFGVPILMEFYNLTLSKTPFFNPKEKFKIDICSENEAVGNFLGNFQASFTDKFSSSISLSYTTTEPSRGRFVLDTLMKDYLDEDLQYKKRTAENTLRFINDRIAHVYKDLDSLQTNFERFKQSHQMLDVAEKSRFIVENQNASTTALDVQNTQLKVIDQLQNYLTSPVNKIIPSNISVVNGTLTAGIDAYNLMVNERQKLSLSMTSDNPLVINFDKQLSYNKAVLIASLASYKNALITTRNEVQKKQQSLSGQLNAVPELEKDYADFQRQKTVKENLYVFLLQKHEDVGITSTSTVSNAQITQPASVGSNPVVPVKSKLITMGLIIGLIIPSVFLVLKEVVNTKILSKSDIESRTTIPIVGEIGHNGTDSPFVMTEDSRSILSEQFRSLRTNLQYLVNANKCNILLVTSTMSGEGKTFLSLNLGNSLALGGKKVVFLELDLRKPKFSASVGVDNSNGYTNFVVSQTKDYDSIVRPLWTNPNCYLVSSGPIPPNPTELLMNQQLENLLDYLKARFDYIIIDTAPVGAVSDGLLLEKYADITLYVIRQGFSDKNQLTFINELAGTNKIKNPYLIVNDITTTRYGYGYGYGYAYGYGYGVEANKKGGLNRFFKKSKS